MKKKLLSFLVAICLVIPCLCLVGCNDTKSSKVMTLKVNPEVEFVLDKDNKVVTVNALNEDCYAILTATWAEDEEAKALSVKLVGMQADEAAELFIKVCDQEHFIQVNATSNVEISISGDRVKNLYNEVKSAIENIEFETKNIVLECEKLAKITKDELVATAKQCYKELSDEYLNGLTEEELIAKIKESREETKNFVNTQVKEFYYQMRDKYILLAKLEAAGLTTKIENVQAQVNEIASKYIEQLLGKASTYKQKMQEYITEKKEWLEANVAGATESALNSLKTAVDEATTAVENALATAQTAINTALDGILGQINTILDTGLNMLDSVLSAIPGYAETLESKIDAKMTELQNSFNSCGSGDYGNYNVNNWISISE